MIMPIQFIAPVIGHMARLGVTSASAKGGLGQFAQSLPFGAGYSLGTYLGFPKNYSTSSKGYQPISFTLDNDMAYNRNRSRRRWFSFNRTGWYNSRTWHRRMRRYVYVHRGRY